MLVAGDVLGDIGAGAFGVAHLAEDTSARAGDAFDGFERSVGIELDAIRGRTGGVTILEGDLAVLHEVGDDGSRRGEAAFAMRERDGVHLADVHAREPRRLDRGDAGMGVTRDVAGDAVVEQRRGGSIDVTDLTIRDEAGLDERLEAVADAEREAVAVLEQLHDSVADDGRLDDGGDELAGTIRFVTGGEAAWDHEDLRAGDGVGKSFERFAEAGGVEITQHEDLGLGAGETERAGGVVFAITTGEDRDDHARLGDAGLGLQAGADGEADRGGRALRLAGLGREDGLEHAFMRGEKVGDGDGRTRPGDLGVGVGLAEHAMRERAEVGG